MIRSSGVSCGDVAKLCSEETESGEITWSGNSVG